MIQDRSNDFEEETSSSCSFGLSVSDQPVDGVSHPTILDCILIEILSCDVIQPGED